MNRFLHGFNLVGVVVLALLCVQQWRVNRKMNLEILGLEKVRQEQADRVEKQTRSLQGLQADLDDFRSRLSQAHTAAREAEARLATQSETLSRQSVELEQLRTNMGRWEAAVAERDEIITTANQKMTDLARDRNAAVTQFNELVGRYNSVVEELNVRTRDYNALVEKSGGTSKAGNQAASKETK